jgi:cysteinyl-tRNA synthetase
VDLYNTLTQRLEPVTTEDGIFRMYVCGITPYDTTHLGHAFTFVYFDVLVRYLEFLGYRTITVQNVTDIDDDILRRAREVGMAWDELARQETAKYQADMRALNVRPPDYYPRATQEIPKIQEMVADLLAKGYAYERNGSVYYDVRRDSDFGELAHMDYHGMLATANQRGNYPDDPNKRDPLDFVLWQAGKPGEPTWDSPWGPGRPGWHIECSAMSMRYLGNQLDIHSGGADLIFPHHTCEIAQSEHYSGVRPFVRYWFHVEMVRLGGEKMSKSLGNMLFIHDLIKTYSADAIRVYLLMHHYRAEWDADTADAELREAEHMLSRWRTALAASLGEPPASAELTPLPYEATFGEAMDEDLDTRQAIDDLDDLADDIIGTAQAGGDVSKAQITLRSLGGVLGLRLGETQT